MHRRSFLQTGLTGTAMAQAASAQGPGIKLGFDTYSVRAFQWKDIQLLDYAAGLKADTIQISDSADYSSLDPNHLRQVKDHAARLGNRDRRGHWLHLPHLEKLESRPRHTRAG